MLIASSFPSGGWPLAEGGGTASPPEAWGLKAAAGKTSFKGIKEFLQFQDHDIKLHLL